MEVRNGLTCNQTVREQVSNLWSLVSKVTLLNGPLTRSAPLIIANICWASAGCQAPLGASLHPQEQSGEWSQNSSCRYVTWSSQRRFGVDQFISIVLRKKVWRSESVAKPRYSPGQSDSGICALCHCVTKFSPDLPSVTVLLNQVSIRSSSALCLLRGSECLSNRLVPSQRMAWL